MIVHASAISHTRIKILDIDLHTDTSSHTSTIARHYVHRDQHRDNKYCVKIAQDGSVNANPRLRGYYLCVHANVVDRLRFRDRYGGIRDGVEFTFTIFIIMYKNSNKYFKFPPFNYFFQGYLKLSNFLIIWYIFEIQYRVLLCFSFFLSFFFFFFFHLIITRGFVSICEDSVISVYSVGSKWFFLKLNQISKRNKCLE